MVSVIIPALDEEALLPACLEAVLPQVRATGSTILVVDGGSRDATREIARRRGVPVVETRPGRGRQMNAGARAAAGSLLVFLPADTLLPQGALESLVRIDQEGAPASGGFRQRFDRPRWGLRLVSALHNLRAGITGVIYGDQVLFVRRSTFEAAGGFREDLDMEDVELGTRLRRYGRPRLLPLTAVTSARRFDRHGDLRATVAAAFVLASWTFTRRIPVSRTFFRPVR